MHLPSITAALALVGLSAATPTEYVSLIVYQDSCL
jgi:hypothetical protein